MEKRNEITSYLENVGVFLLGLIFLGFPLITSTITSDSFVLPKQIFMATIIGICFILFGVKMIVEKSIKIRRTPFDLPILLFALAILLSSLFSADRADSLIAFVPLLFAVILYFVLIGSVRKGWNFLFLASAFVLGGTILSIISTLSFFKIYILPFTFTHQPAFTPLGSLLDQAIYLTILLPAVGYYLLNLVKAKQINAKTIFFTIASITITIGLIVTIFQLFTSAKPIILPFLTGFQTGFAEISQDTGRILPGFLFGSGFGTYVTDFARFKPIAFNQNSSLWTMTFYRSFSAVLEFLATIGILGISAFIFLITKIIKEIKGNRYNIMLYPLIIAIAALFFLPLSYISLTLFFMILGLFATVSINLSDVEFQLVSLKKGLITLEPVTPKTGKSIILPSIFMIVILLITGALGYLSITYVLSDAEFASSLVAASNNDGTLTYQDQTKAISLFKYRPAIYRSFSQTNIALANSILGQQPHGSSLPADLKQTIMTLIQQSINSARNSTTLAPISSVDWQNFASVYKSLIGVGQNAENFAIETSQQAIKLDPNNPEEYLDLGGIYYQLKNYDNALIQFQAAINLKPDYANAYYNLGHAYLSKGDTKNALTAFQTVKSLVTNDQVSLSQINQEINSLQNQNATQKAANNTNGQATQSQNGLNVNALQAQSPSQGQRITIPAPKTSL